VTLVKFPRPGKAAYADLDCIHVLAFYMLLDEMPIDEMFVG
jgi:hypothetical protein